MDSTEIKYFSERPSAEEVFDALRGHGGAIVDCYADGEYPDNLAVAARTATDSHEGIGWYENATATLYRITWTKRSWSRHADIAYGMSIIDVERGGLAPDGWASLDRYIGPLTDGDAEVEALLALAIRRKLPEFIGSREF